MVKEWKVIAAGKPITLDQLAVASKELLNASDKRTVWLFQGEMGSGKTTLIKSVCKELGVLTSMSSPTFSLINEYSTTDDTLYHFDLYRLKKEEEAYDIGVEEYFDSGKYCFVEWPEKIPSLWQPEYFLIRLQEHNETTRIIEYGFYVREKEIGI